MSPGYPRPVYAGPDTGSPGGSLREITWHTPASGK